MWAAACGGPPIVNAPPRPGPIVALGDSLTAGTGAPPGQSYPEQLARLIGRPVINAGVPGDRVADAAARLERDVLVHRPGIVIVLLGGNDLLQRADLDAAFAQLEALVERLQAAGAMVVLVGLENHVPLTGKVGWRYRTLARRRGCVWVPDALRGIMGRPALMADAIHPNAAGYGRLAERLARALRPYLDAAEEANLDRPEATERNRLGCGRGLV